MKYTTDFVQGTRLQKILKDTHDAKWEVDSLSYSYELNTNNLDLGSMDVPAWSLVAMLNFFMKKGIDIHLSSNSKQWTWTVKTERERFISTRQEPIDALYNLIIMLNDNKCFDENKSDVTIFEPIGDFDKVCDAEISLCHAIKLIEKTNLEEKELPYIREKKKKILENYQKILDFISNYWGKYVHLNFKSKFGSEYDTQYDVLLDSYIPETHSLFGIFSIINDKYNSYVSYKSIDLFDFVQKRQLEINEITEEEFLKHAKESMERCLTDRTDKIESGNYVLTKNGYEKGTDIEIDFSLKNDNIYERD